MIDPHAMQGKTCLVTGATGGIGRVTAEALAARGARVLAVGRNPARGGDLVDSAGAANGGVEFLRADLSSQAEIRRLADDVLERAPRLDVLINNAGVMFGRRELSADGIEMTFAVNHVAYFLLTLLLLPALRNAAPSRVINVSSNAHRGVALDFDNLQGERHYRGWRAYRRSKLCNLYFSYALAPRLADDGVSVNALHPGFVKTRLGSANRWTSALVWRLMSLAAISVEEGAQTSIYLAVSPDVAGVTGKYFYQCRPVESSPQSYDMAAAARLWDISERLTGL